MDKDAAFRQDAMPDGLAPTIQFLAPWTLGAQEHMLRQLSILSIVILSLSSVEVRADTPTPNEKIGPNDAWILIGVQPDKARIDIVHTTVKDGYVRRIGTQLFLYKPADGFVLVKVNPGDVYGISQSALKSGNTFFQILYQAKCAMPTFHANAGKVEYITNVTFRSEGVRTDGQLITFEGSSHFNSDPESAKAFLSSHHPELIDKFEQGAYQMTPFTQKCRAP